MELVIATTNEHKIDEINKILAPYHVNVKGLNFYPNIKPPPETGSTFDENAYIKAKVISDKLSDKWVLADDSGLAVYVLNGAPGVHSARFATDGRDYNANNKKLLTLMNGIEDRTAAFVCAMVLISPDGKEWHVEGRCEGKITDKETGKNGFGYDPLFIPDGFDKTFAELNMNIKNQISHRGKALSKIISILTSSSNATL